MRRHAAQNWRIPSLLVIAALGVSLLMAPRAESSASGRRASARAQFDRAERLRIGLESKPRTERSEEDYLKVISAFRRVHLITPRSPEAPSAFFAVAELYREMGRLLDKKYYQSAIDAYQFLLHEYPTSRFRDDAVLTVGAIYKDHLHQLDLAEKTYEQFLKYHPHSAKSKTAQDALVEIARLRRATGKSVPVREVTREIAPDRKAGLPEVTLIRTWNGENYTRIVIEIEDQVQYEGARLSEPDRIYFDLHKAKLSAALARNGFEIKSDFLKTIRVAQNQAGVVRVVFEVDNVKEYSAFFLPNPYRLVVDIYGSKPMTAKASPAPVPPVEKAVEKITEKPADPEPKPEKSVARKVEAPSAPPPITHPAPSGTVPSVAAKTEPDSPTKTGKGKASRSAREIAAAALKPPSVPQPTRDGQPSLTRALGLKIGRIVIDAGHGGSDTGTVGPSGLMEKDLCLDVALRLGRIIQERLPAAEVVFTRQDDTFVPLEERTAIANQARADLFISIHANSSPDHKARGVETYYLNFAASPEAMEVASRENAMSQGSIHELEEIVQKIARNEKIEESRELASEIQESLSKRLQRLAGSMKSRGVRKAPFVVLIGANMPSVLSEISFISNPTDERLLKKPENRQRVAEGLYFGVQSYLQSINSLTLNLPPKAPLGARAGGVARDGNQQ